MAGRIQDKFGPGIWFAIHQMAYKTDNDITLRRSFITYIHAFADNFPCGECRVHFKNYLADNPLDNVTEFFKWTHQFHNAVNKRLNKPIVPYDEAIIQYKTSTPICTDECGSNSTTPSNTSRRYYTIKSYYEMAKMQ